MTSKVLNGGTNSIPWTVDGTTNRFNSGASYDLNGNLLTGPGVTLTYDEANRVASATTGSGMEYYGYGADNKRIYRETSSGGEEWVLYGGQGEKLGVFTWGDTSGTGDCPCLLMPQTSDVWFAGKLIWDGRKYIGSPVNLYPAGAPYQDRVGTNRADGARFYPYGEEIGTATANDHEKFATYQRDDYTKLDYADQRYYASSYGRFTTADRLASSAMASDPGSWNRYAYVGGDPVNRSDPSGRCYVDASGNSVEDWDYQAGIYSDELDVSSAEYYAGSCGDVLSGTDSGGGGGGGGDGSSGLPVFANDLGNCSDASSCMAFAQGTGDNSVDSSSSSSASSSPSCETTILSAVNSTFGDNFTSSNITNEFQFSAGALPGQGTLNLNISVPVSSQPSGISAGRYPLNWWTYIVGIGPTLHVPAGPGGSDSPQTLPLSPSQFTTHIDSSLPYNPIGLVAHLLLDMTPLGGYKDCPWN